MVRGTDEQRSTLPNLGLLASQVIDTVANANHFWTNIMGMALNGKGIDLLALSRLNSSKRYLWQS